MGTSTILASREVEMERTFSDELGESSAGFVLLAEFYTNVSGEL